MLLTVSPLSAGISLAAVMPAALIERLLGHRDHNGNRLMMYEKNEGGTNHSDHWSTKKLETSDGLQAKRFSGQAPHLSAVIRLFGLD